MHNKLHESVMNRNVNKFIASHETCFSMLFIIKRCLYHNLTFEVKGL